MGPDGETTPGLDGDLLILPLDILPLQLPFPEGQSVGPDGEVTPGLDGVLLILPLMLPLLFGAATGVITLVGGTTGSGTGGICGTACGGGRTSRSWETVSTYFVKYSSISHVTSSG